MKSFWTKDYMSDVLDKIKAVNAARKMAIDAIKQVNASVASTYRLMIQQPSTISSIVSQIEPIKIFSILITKFQWYLHSLS